jgi:hypothetical protein
MADRLFEGRWRSQRDGLGGGAPGAPTSEAVLPTLDAQVRCEYPLRPGDRAERFLEATSHEGSEACRIHEVVRCLARSNLLGLVPEANFPQVPEGMPKVRCQLRVHLPCDNRCIQAR